MQYLAPSADSVEAARPVGSWSIGGAITSVARCGCLDDGAHALELGGEGELLHRLLGTTEVVVRGAAGHTIVVHALQEAQHGALGLRAHKLGAVGALVETLERRAVHRDALAQQLDGSHRPSTVWLVRQPANSLCERGGADVFAAPTPGCAVVVVTGVGRRSGDGDLIMPSRGRRISWSWQA